MADVDGAKRMNKDAQDGQDGYVWRLRKWMPERYGCRCRVLCRGRGPGPRNVLVEFEDGCRFVTTRWAVRKRPNANGA